MATRSRVSGEDLAAILADLTGHMSNLATTVANMSEQIQHLSTDSAPAAAATAPNPSAVFALSPGMAYADQIIDMTTKRGQSLYDTGVSRLDTAFDLSLKNTIIFETELTNRATMMGWNSKNQGILHFKDSDNQLVHLIKEYGRVEAAAIRTQCEPFINGVNSQNRAAQNNNMMAQCLMASLSTSARQSVMAHTSDYEVIPDGATQPIMVAPLLYKTIMRLATLDSTATITAMKSDITNISRYALECGGDLTKITNRITVRYNHLVARGIDMKEDAVQAVLKMLANDIPDDNFKKYFKQKEADYWDETTEMKGITLEALIKKATTKYNLLKSQGRWGVLSQEAQDIIALQAELKQVQDSNLKLAKEVRDQAALESKSSDASSDDNETKKNDKPAWMKSPPKDDEPKSKTMNGKTFHWCSHHKAWGTHSEQDCRLGKARSTEGGTETTTDSQAVTSVAKQAHSPDFQAYSALMEHLRQATACQADFE